MTFLTISDAKQFSREAELMIYVRIDRVEGIFQIYPGGRAIRRPETEQNVKRLTTEDQWRKRRQQQ